MFASRAVCGRHVDFLHACVSCRRSGGIYQIVIRRVAAFVIERPTLHADPRTALGRPVRIARRQSLKVVPAKRLCHWFSAEFR